MTAEQWRPIPHVHGYEVSDHGRVRSFRQGAPEGGRILRPIITHGYAVVNLPRTDGAFRVRRIHQLVLEVFIGPRPQGMPEIRHINDVKTDNRLTNLTYGTQSENLHDRVANGIHHWAKRTHCKNDHEFTPENTTWRTGSKTGRMCKQCCRDSARRHRERVAAEAISTRRAVADRSSA